MEDGGGGSDSNVELIKKCAVCEENGKFKCGNCKTTNYCCKEHQKSHWKSHKQNCFPVTPGWDSVRGNELVATRDIAQGEIILKEKPVVSGPSGKADVSLPICLGCNSVCLDLKYSCSNCNWPICSQNCEKESVHADFECQILKRQNIAPFSRHNQQYEYLFILRCCLLKTLDPKRWAGFQQLESHVEEREANFMESLLHLAAIEFIQNACGLGSSVPANDIKFSSGVINTNAMGHDFGASKTGIARKCGSYLYLLGCLICHSCTPNTYRAIQPNGELHVRAIIPIKAGEPFLTTYTDLALTSQERRSYLSSFYYFICTCSRCSDPTELGTFFSGVKCPELTCASGHLLPDENLDLSSSWTCNNPTCGVSKTSEYISNVLNKVKNELEGISKGNTEKAIEETEKYLTRHSGVTLHPNHALIYRGEYNIIQTIDYMLAASLIADPNVRFRMAKRQVVLVTKALDLMGTFWRGYSSYRGRLLYYLQNAQLRLALTKVAQNLREQKRSMAEKLAVEKDLKEILELRKQAAKILIFDPLGKDERAIAERLENCDTPEIQIALKYCTV